MCGDLLGRFLGMADVEVAAQVLSLLCPLGQKRLQEPVVGRRCRHDQPFDRKTFRLLHASIKSKPNSKRMLCPICRAPISAMCDLVVSTKYQKLIDNLPATCMQASVSADGNVQGIQGLTIDIMNAHNPEIPYNAHDVGAQARRRQQEVPEVQFVKSEFKNPTLPRGRKAKGGALLKGLMSGLTKLQDSVKGASGGSSCRGIGSGSAAEQELQYYSQSGIQQELAAFRQWAMFQVCYFQLRMVQHAVLQHAALQHAVEQRDCHSSHHPSPQCSHHLLCLLTSSRCKALCPTQPLALPR
jgi:hypothetical protein